MTTDIDSASGREHAAPRAKPRVRWLWWLAVLALLATLLGRMMPPPALAVVATMLGRWLGSATMLGLGVGQLVRLLEIVGAALSQLFAMTAIVALLTLISVIARSELRYYVRIGSIVVGSFVILVVLIAQLGRVSGVPSALTGVFASALAVAAAWEARGPGFARPAALTLGLLGTGAIIRLCGVALAFLAGSLPSTALITAARVVATVAFVMDALAIFTATAALALRGFRRVNKAESDGPSGSPRLTSPLTIVAMGLALLATRQALRGGLEDAGLGNVLVRRAFEGLLTRPEPFIPLGMQIFLAALSVVAALLALVAPSQLPALAGSLSLVLISRGTPEMPLGALGFVAAAYGVMLAAHDPRGFWAVILAQGRPTQGQTEDGPPAKPDDDEVRHVDADHDTR